MKGEGQGVLSVRADTDGACRSREGKRQRLLLVRETGGGGEAAAGRTGCPLREKMTMPRRSVSRTTGDYRRRCVMYPKF